ncbi:MAG: hypothetical protein R3279_02845 [Putridiphycobacter sp.]|nr:hypothetical protein [Putridiphycobacter sp.]
MNLSNLFKIIVSAAFVVILCSLYSKQKKVEIIISLFEEVDSVEVPLMASVEVYTKGKLLVRKESTETGKVPAIFMPTGKVYQIFIKKEGYVTKMAELDAKIADVENAPDPLYLSFQTVLFKEIEGVDFSFLEVTPLVKFDFDADYYYRFDKGYTIEMLKRVEALRQRTD